MIHTSIILSGPIVTTIEIVLAQNRYLGIILIFVIFLLLSIFITLLFLEYLCG